MTFRKMRFAGILLGLCLVQGTAGADVPDSTPLTYQGRLLQNGVPVADTDADTNYTMGFEFYSDAIATGASRLCGDVFGAAVVITGGNFTHTIADPTCKQALGAAGTQVFIKIVGGGGPLGSGPIEIARHQVSTGVFALRAGSGGGNIGDIKASMLTQAQFDQVHGSGWRMADGTTAVGTAYGALTGATTLPDLRGIFLRGKDNGRLAENGNGNPDGEVPLGTFLQDSFKAHEHSVLRTAGDEQLLGGIQGALAGGSTDVNPNGLTSTEGGVETRPRNVTVNYYIRVD